MKNLDLAKRAVIVWLCLSMPVSASACKKKSKGTENKTEVLASDPYFNSEVYDLQIPLDDTKEIRTLDVLSVDYLGDQVSVQYEVSYVTPEVYDIFQQSREYNKAGTAVFDLKGNLISNEQSELGGSKAASFRTHDKEGNTVSLCRVQEPGVNKLVTEIVFSDETGKELKRIPVDAPGDLKYAWFFTLQLLEDGRMILTETSGTPHVIDGNGRYLFAITSMECTPASDVFSSEGKYYVITRPHDLQGNCKLSEVDMTTGTIRPGRELNNFYLDPRLMVAGEDGIYSSSTSGIFRLNPSTCELEEVLNWNQTDLNRNTLSTIRCYPKNSDEIIAVSQGGFVSIKNEPIHVVHLSRASSNPHAGKKALNVGGFVIPNKIYDYCCQYNADPSHKARMVVTDYSERIDQTDAMASLKELEDKLRLDLMSGTGPDILVNFSSSDEFARDDLLVDLNPYIDGPDGLDRSEFFDNIFRAAEVDGKLYCAPIAFRLSGYMENTAILETDRNWTLDDLDQAVSSLSGDAEIFPDTEYDSLLYYFIGADTTKYMDREKKETHFFCDSMKRILQETRKYGKSKVSDLDMQSSRTILVDSGYFDIYGYNPAEPGGEALFREGNYAMISAYIPDAAEYAYLQGLAGNKGKLVGYPSHDGDGVIANLSFSLSIVKSSSFRDEAWDIIRGLYEDEPQTMLASEISSFEPSYFPLRRSAFEKTSKDMFEKVDKAYKKWVKDSADPSNAITFVYFPLKEGIYEDLLETIESIRYTYHSYDSLNDILSEETAGYFAGSRSEEDVLKNIDNRARQILQER